MNFIDSLKQNNLGEMLEAEFSRWGHFTAEAADLVIEVSKLEKISPELLAYTWVKESCFTMRPRPNDNGHPECIFGFDCGPAQINMGWAYKSVWVKEYSADALHYSNVFGDRFYELDGKTPCVFNGDPMSNLRMAARRLNARKGDDELRATLYPGPKSQPNRREGWKKYGELFRNFFLLYTP